MNPPNPTSADPAATFTCSGAPNSSVKAVLAEVSLPPTMWRNNEDGTIKWSERGALDSEGSSSRDSEGRIHDGNRVPRWVG